MLEKKTPLGLIKGTLFLLIIYLHYGVVRVTYQKNASYRPKIRKLSVKRIQIINRNMQVIVQKVKNNKKKKKKKCKSLI